MGSTLAPRIDAWTDMVRIDRRLDWLARRVRAERPARGTDDWPGWSRITHELRTIVGWGAALEELRSCEAYNLGYRHLLDLWEGAT